MSDTPFTQIQGSLDLGLLLVCDHASNFVPKEYKKLGLPENAFERHIAYDPGAAAVTEFLCAELGCPAVLSNFSRLLIDPNRGADDPTLIMRLSDGQVIPANKSITKMQRQERIEKFHAPYHAAISEKLDAFEAAGITPAILSIHSFTPNWKGDARPWHATVLADFKLAMCDFLLEGLGQIDDKTIGYNEPYDGALKGDCMHTHGIRRGLQHALIELRQDEIADTAGQKFWAKQIAPLVHRFCSEVENRRKSFVVSRAGTYLTHEV